MITHSIQISELLPDTFVKIILNSGKHLYGFLHTSGWDEEAVLVTSNVTDPGGASEIHVETIDTKNVLSIDPFLK